LYHLWLRLRWLFEDKTENTLTPTDTNQGQTVDVDWYVIWKWVFWRMDYEALHQNAREAAEFLKTLGNEWRLMILCSLGDAEKSVGTLENELGIKQSALSQHLARLRRDRLVKTRREAQTIYYSLADQNIMKIIAVLQETFCPPEQTK
tara:strand:- start:150 stop:593 length:444 start_codon:yes stop_codon:yes gene_type:complete